MQIVIDIPEEDWEFIKESDGCRWSRAIIEGVINGAPLPKGHGRLIDVDKVISDGISKGFCDWYDEMKSAPTIIEADKEEEARWKKLVDDFKKCSKCGKVVKTYRNYKHCPECGARMIESEEER